MRIAFIISAYRTIFFSKLAPLLEREGHEVYWISPNRRWADYLRAQGIPEERIFDATAHGPEWRRAPAPTPDDRALLAQCEKKSGWMLYDLIQMDELLRRRPTPYALRYLAVCARHVIEFLQTRRVQVVSGEQTWAFELMLGQVCALLEVPFWRPISIRVPLDRFVFCTNRLEKDFIYFREPTDADRELARQAIDSVRNRPRDSYASIASLQVFKPHWQRLKLLAKHLWDVAWDRYDETTLGPFGLVKKYLAMTWREFRNRRARIFEEPKLPPERPFIYFPMHLQPEMSIDVMGNPYTNQIEVLRAVARTLPVTHDLWVKEHTIAMSKRTMAQYREIAAIPGVRLVQPRMGSLAIIEHADLTLTITGTSALEAAFLHRPGALMAPCVFDPIVRVLRFRPFSDSIARVLEDVRNRPSVSEEELVNYMAWLMAQSWPGHIGDQLWFPQSLSDENRRLVADAFLALLRRQEQGDCKVAEYPTRRPGLPSPERARS
jgi:hypothetical protein